MNPPLVPPDWAYARVCVAGGRLLVRWSVANRWAVVQADFRRTFPRHRDAVWRRRDRCWSLPLCQRARLGEWLTVWKFRVVEEVPL